MGTDVGTSFLNTVELIYDAAAQPSVWPEALSAIARKVDAKGAILIWQRDDGHFGTVASPEIEAAQKDYVDGGWLARDIRANRSIERGYFFNGEPFGDLHVCSLEEIRSHPFYRQFLARHDLGWFGAVAVSPDPHTAVALSIQRSPRISDPFDETELATIAQLGRYVEKSLRFSIRLMDAEVARDGLSTALSRVSVAAFVLDGLGRVIFKNEAASLLLGDGVSMHSDRLTATARQSQHAFEALVSSVVEGGQSNLLSEVPPCFLIRDTPKRSLVAYGLPLRPTSQIADQIAQRARAMVLLMDPEKETTIDPAVVRDFLGLTLGEAKVATLVGSGLTPRDASVQLGIAEETARSLLKRVFNKTGIGRQAELVGLLAKISSAK